MKKVSYLGACSFTADSYETNVYKEDLTLVIISYEICVTRRRLEFHRFIWNDHEYEIISFEIYGRLIFFI